MSAYMVDKKLIDGLLTYGIETARHGPLRWTDPAFWTADDHEHAFQSGQPWGDLSVHQQYARELTRETAERVGAMLWAENQRSVNFRYEEEELEYCYTYKRFSPGSGLSPAGVLAGIGCYEYQACEHVQWRTSEAYAFCDALRSLAIRNLPDPEEGYWWH